MDTRTFTDLEGTPWDAFAAAATVAHGKQGAVLAFRRPGDPEDEFVRTTITFNSMAAARFALGSMSEKELRRRLDLARAAVGGI
jgi:hypothetical protein